jgi:thioredoxin 1
MTTTHLTVDLEPALAAPKALLYFTAAWCAPCKMFGPILAKFAENNPEIMVVKIDADEKRDLLSLYGVRGIPTVIALEFGAEKTRQTGLTDESKLRDMFA